jgi:AcrR family transcriptional regulator
MTDQSTAFTTSQRPAGGRPLDSTRDDAIRAAALKVLGEVGYDLLTIDAVAAEARAGKATVYRRWPSKAELVIDAVACIHPEQHEPRDTGSLRGDLHALLDDKRAQTEGQVEQMLGLVSALPRSADLQRIFRERFVEPRQGSLATIVERGIARGEVDPARSELLLSVFPALMLYRLIMTGQLPDPEYARSVIDQLLLPLALPPG